MNFLEVKENTIQSRLEKTKREFNNIRQQTADGENKTISPKTYQTITDKMNKMLKTLAAESKHPEKRMCHVSQWFPSCCGIVADSASVFTLGSLLALSS